MNRILAQRLIYRPFRSVYNFPQKLHLPLRSHSQPIPNARWVASTVSNKPASQTFEHAATNIKEELGNSTTDLAKAIAGANMTKGGLFTSTEHNSFLGITGLIASEVPKPILVFGLTGTLPYVATGIATVFLGNVASAAASGLATNIDPRVALLYLDQAMHVQVGYGAVILGFLGALHWGMEFAGYGGQKGYQRLALGSAPVLLAWQSLAFQPTVALAVQWIGFTAMWWADARVTTLGWTPEWYSQYRFYLSILVGTCIIGTLAGTSLYGPMAEHGLLAHKLEMLREERRELSREDLKVIPIDDVEVVPSDVEGSHYMQIRRKFHD